MEGGNCQGSRRSDYREIADAANIKDNRSGEFQATFPSGYFLQSQFFDYACHSGISVQSPQDEADVDADAFVVAVLTPDIAGKGFLVAVKGKAYEFALRVQDRAS